LDTPVAERFPSRLLRAARLLKAMDPARGMDYANGRCGPDPEVSMIAHAPRSIAALLALALAGCFNNDTIDWDDKNIGPSGSSEPAILAVGVTVIDFGEVTYGQSYTEQLHVENVGGDELVLSGITATSPFSANYASDVTITPGGSTTLVVRYQPTEYAAHEGSFSFTWNSPPEEGDTGYVDLLHEIPLYGTVLADVDGDGHDCEAAGGDDCDDEDDSTYPGATEQWYDGQDQDCQGDDDYDQDGDGYQVTYKNEDWADMGGDCNDANPDVYPGAPDIWYDNVDSNCDGRDDWDQDNDGYRTTLGDRGNDCDDTNASISPGAEEDPTNGIDDDCDGRVDES
jgi:hypothetical protein